MARTSCGSRTPPERPPPKPSRRAWNGIATTAFPGRTRAQRPLQSAGTDGAQSAWTGTTVYSVFLSYGAHAEAVHGAAWCKRSAAHCVKHSVPPSAQCTLRTKGRLASGREKPILRRRRRPPQPRPRRRGSPPASCAAMWWHTPAPPLSSGLILSTMGCGSLQNGCDPLQGATDRAQAAAGRLQPHKPLRVQSRPGAAPHGHAQHHSAGGSSMTSHCCRCRCGAASAKVGRLRTTMASVQCGCSA